MAFFYILLGLYAFITGLWATITWPMPGSYNLVLMDPWPLYGMALLLIGIAILAGFNPVGVSYGLAALGSPILAYYGGNGRGVAKYIAIIAIIVLVIAALISLYIGIEAASGHIDRWAKWTPWYGKVEVPS